MRNTTRLLIAATLLALAVPNSAQPAAGSAAPPAQMPKQFHFKKTTDVTVNYLLHLPRDYTDKAEKRWPLILFLHGAGERGTDIWKVATHGPVKYVSAHPELPFIIVSPQCPERQTWSKEVLLALLDEITAKYAVDTNRIYLTGLSMGGYGTWALGTTYPSKFAALVPICGGGELISVLMSSRDEGPALKSLGVWAFHGAKDPVVPVQESQRMVDLLKKMGVQEVKFTVYPEADHNSWTETYNNPELYEWLLKHERR